MLSAAALIVKCDHHQIVTKCDHHVSVTKCDHHQIVTKCDHHQSVTTGQTDTDERTYARTDNHRIKWSL